MFIHRRGLWVGSKMFACEQGMWLGMEGSSRTRPNSKLQTVQLVCCLFVLACHSRNMDFWKQTH